MSVLAALSAAGSKISGLLSSGITRGLSSNAILNTLRGQGLGYRRTTFLADMRVLREAKDVWSAIRYVTRKAVPSARHYLTAAKPMIERYQTTIELRGYNAKTGVSEVRHVSVHHETLETREELEEKAIEEAEEASPDFIITDVLPVAGFTSPFTQYSLY